MFKIIVCVNKKGVIGKDGKLLYRIKNDIENFKSMTSYNGVVIMGRKTFESLPNRKPLPGRVNIIMTRDVEYKVEPMENLYITNSIEDTIELCDAFFSDKELFVIGGQSIYELFIETGLVSEMILTVVDDDADGDAYFPPFDSEGWYVYYESSKQSGLSGRNKVSFSLKVLKKKDDASLPRQ